MTVENPSVVDLVSVDPLSGIVVLTLTEVREWGDRGELLPDLENKLNTYLEYVEGGQLAAHYPDVATNPVSFRLHYMYELTAREREFLRIVVQRHLNPRGIGWEQELLRAESIRSPN